MTMSEPPPSDRTFAGLYQRTLTPLRQHLARILGNSAEAQDVAHDAYLRVYPLVEKQKAQKPEALLYTTARRLAFNRLKRRRIVPFLPEPPADDALPSATPGAAEGRASSAGGSARKGTMRRRLRRLKASRRAGV